MVIRNPNEPIYPSGDGKPMAENTVQYRWITVIKGGMDVVFRNDPNVFVAGDLLWYPVRGEPEIRTAPDTLIVFGRPKGDRMSYLQWEENDIAPQVVFEVLSPSNTTSEMAAKLGWYEQYGVEEYYVYDPDRQILQGWIRKGETLCGIPGIRHGFTSPRTGVHLQIQTELVLTGPDGRTFLDYPELALERDRLEQEAVRERSRAEQEHARAEHERHERELAQETVRQERERAQQEQQERLAAEDRARLETERAERERLERLAAEEKTRLETERAERERERAEKALLELAQLRQLLQAQGIDPENHEGQ